MLFTGEAVSAVEAARIGLINRAVPASELDQLVDGYVTKINNLSGAALRLAKRALRLGGGWSHLPVVEKLYLEEVMATADAAEGVASFIEKRTPVWRHQ
jgi:cyclohexa-1,5-dienecarbonyl-CoA hydratase